MVWNAHELAVHIFRRGHNGDVIPQALAHLNLAVGAGQALPHDDCDLRPLAQRLLELAPGHNDIKQLILPADLDVGFLRYSIVGLHQGIEELVELNGLPRLVTLAEVVPRQELLHGEVAR